MPDMVVWWVAGGVLLLLVIVQVCARSRHPIRNAVGGMMLGWLSLLAVNVSGVFTGVTLPLSPLSLGVAGAAGIPGVTVLLLLNMVMIP